MFKTKTFFSLIKRKNISKLTKILSPFDNIGLLFPESIPVLAILSQSKKCKKHSTFYFHLPPNKHKTNTIILRNIVSINKSIIYSYYLFISTFKRLMKSEHIKNISEMILIAAIPFFPSTFQTLDFFQL